VALKRIAHRSSSATGPRTSRARTRARWTRFSSPGLPCAVRRGMERNTSVQLCAQRQRASQSWLLLRSECVCWCRTEHRIVANELGTRIRLWTQCTHKRAVGSAVRAQRARRKLSLCCRCATVRNGWFIVLLDQTESGMAPQFAESARAAPRPRSSFMRLDAASPRTDALFFSVPSRRPYIRGALCELPCPHRMLRSYPLSAHRNSTDSRSSLILKITKMRSSGGDVHRSCSFW
jgi:hypothetical protein